MKKTCNKYVLFVEIHPYILLLFTRLEKAYEEAVTTLNHQFVACSQRKLNNICTIWRSISLWFVFLSLSKKEVTVMTPLLTSNPPVLLDTFQMLEPRSEASRRKHPN